jgi:ACS family tartrate transporter-like MFS transporter
LLPFVFLLYIINYLDRTSVAYAALGMSRDLGFDDRVLGWESGFSSSVMSSCRYRLRCSPNGGARAGVICATMIVSGMLTALHRTRAHSRTTLSRTLLVRRSRSWFIPGRNRLFKPLVHSRGPGESDGQLHGCNSVSLVIAIPVAGWILSHNWFMIEGWRWLFFLEGIPAILLGTVAFFFLTDWPPQARWLTIKQRQWISQKLEQGKAIESAD